jgi:hypothetical protein
MAVPVILQGSIRVGRYWRNQAAKVGTLQPVTEADAALKARIIAHCARMAKLDREYAVWAFNQYCEAMPWLELKKK